MERNYCLNEDILLKKRRLDNERHIGLKVEASPLMTTSSITSDQFTLQSAISRLKDHRPTTAIKSAGAAIKLHKQSDQQKPLTATKSSDGSEQKMHQCIPIFGSFETKDKPRAIIGIIKSKEKRVEYFSVDWKERKDGLKPHNSCVSFAEFREYDPMFLLDFYEKQPIRISEKQCRVMNKF